MEHEGAKSLNPQHNINFQPSNKNKEKLADMYQKHV